MGTQTSREECSPTAWSPLFQTEDDGLGACPLFQAGGDGHAPNPIYHSLMRAFFSRLDTSNTGVLTPGSFSSFMDVQNYPLEDNAWKYSLQQAADSQDSDPLSTADSSFRTVLECHECEHRISTRAGHPNSQVPLVTLAGFTSYFALSYSRFPDLAHERVNAALEHYNVWPELGPLPRDMLPAEPLGTGIDSELFAQEEQDTAEPFAELADTLRNLEYHIYQAQQAAAAEAAMMKAQQAAQLANMLAAQHFAAQLRAQGYRNALELIGDVKYEYRTEYRQSRYGYDPSSLI
ncbi:hypothetical protein MFIFM68171_06249 [Madurella fahalii]|uniref:DUF7514 domain-containing protein n=1 Tax=Madurella fahalii TaxID=1157608 RepID=A0ABQ0GE69_9PEZI